MKTINDLSELAMHDPIIKNYMILASTGEITEEAALVGMVKTLSESNKQLRDEYIKHLQNCKVSTYKPFEGVGPNPTIAKQIKAMEDHK